MARIYDSPNFDPINASAEFHRAIQGIGTDKLKVIRILASLSNQQRQLVKSKYEYLYNKSIIKDIKNETTVNGSFKDCILALLSTPHEYDAKNLFESINGVGSQRPAFLGLIPSHARNLTRAIIIIETILTRDHDDLKRIQESYLKQYKSPLEYEIKKCSILSEPLIRFLCSILNKKKFENTGLDDLVASSDAKRLHRSETNLKNFENEIIRIFSQATFEQAKRIAEEYYNKTSRNLYERIAKYVELDEYFRQSLLIFLDCATDMPRYFAKRLQEAFKTSSSSKDNALIRIIVSRSEIDLESIMEKYKEITRKLLFESLNEKLSGNFQKLLKAIVGENENKRKPQLAFHRTESLYPEYLYNEATSQRNRTPHLYASSAHRTENILSSESDSVSWRSFNDENKSMHSFFDPSKLSNTLEENPNKLDENQTKLNLNRKESQNTTNNTHDNSTLTSSSSTSTPTSDRKNSSLKKIIKNSNIEDDGIMRICSYSHVYIKEINYMFVPNRPIEENLIKIRNIEIHSSKVVKFVIKRPQEFKFKAGDYLNIRFLDYDLKNQWFSCTITSAPENKVCNWFQKLAKNSSEITSEYEVFDEKTNTYKVLNKIKILEGVELTAEMLGPYGTLNYASLWRIFNHEHVVLILYGSEIQPYASFLKSLLHRVSNPDDESELTPKWYNGPLNLKKIDFIWMNRDYYMYEWFLEFLSDLEFKNSNNELKNLISIQVHMTQFKTPKLIKKSNNEESNRESASYNNNFVLRLNQNLPNFEKMLRTIKSQSRDSSSVVHVFFSGPRELGHKIDEVCNKFEFKYSRQYL